MECERCGKDVLDVVYSLNGKLCSSCITLNDVKPNGYWSKMIKQHKYGIEWS